MNLLEFWWVVFLLIPVYLIYKRTQKGQGVGNFGYDETKLILVYLGLVVVCYIFQRFIFTTHLYLFIYLLIFIPIFSVFIFMLLSKDNVLVIESTMDSEIFYDIKMLDKRYAEATRTRAFMIDRDAYREIRHVGEIDYKYWNGGDGVKFTDYFDTENGVMYHPVVSELHNISFFIAKSFWLKMKQDLPDLIRQNALLTWLAPYKTAYEQSQLAENFELRLRNIERQYEDKPFYLPDDIKKLWQHEIEMRRRDRVAGENKIPEENTNNANNPETPDNAKSTNEGAKT